MADAFDEAWPLVKDFFFGGPDKRGRMDYKGLNSAVRAGHKWAKDDELRRLARASTLGHLRRGGHTEVATTVTPPEWKPREAWGAKGNPNVQPWRAVNLTEMGRRAAKKRGIKESEAIFDMSDQLTHEATHSALELPLREARPRSKQELDSWHEFGAILGETSAQRPPGRFRRLLGLGPRDDRKKRFREVLGGNPAYKGPR